MNRTILRRIWKREILWATIVSALMLSTLVQIPGPHQGASAPGGQSPALQSSVKEPGPARGPVSSTSQLPPDFGHTQIEPALETGTFSPIGYDPSPPSAGIRPEGSPAAVGNVSSCSSILGGTACVIHGFSLGSNTSQIVAVVMPYSSLSTIAPTMALTTGNHTVFTFQTRIGPGDYTSGSGLHPAMGFWLSPYHIYGSAHFFPPAGTYNLSYSPGTPTGLSVIEIKNAALGFLYDTSGSGTPYDPNTPILFGDNLTAAVPFVGDPNTLPAASLTAEICVMGIAVGDAQNDSSLTARTSGLIQRTDFLTPVPTAGRIVSFTATIQTTTPSPTFLAVTLGGSFNKVWVAGWICIPGQSSVPYAPYDVVPSSFSLTSITLSWLENNSFLIVKYFVGYSIDYGLSSSEGSYKNVTTTTETLAAQLTGLVSHSVYYISIAEEDPNGYGAYSAAILAGTTGSGSGSTCQVICYPPNVALAFNSTGIVGAGKNGSGVTIAIVDSFAGQENQSAIWSDYNVSCTDYGLPTGGLSFVYVNTNGANFNGTSINPSWDVEDALDPQWVHAMAPGASIIMVLTNGTGFSLYTAVGDVINRSLANIITMSWGEGSVAASQDGSYRVFNSSLAAAASHHVILLAASGDSGYAGGITLYPAASPYVTAVGGVVLTTYATNSTINSESGWTLSGGGFGPDTRPTWQADIGWSLYPLHGIPDVAAVGGSPMAVVFEATYLVAEGTSFASPTWAGFLADIESYVGPSFTYSETHLYGIYANRTAWRQAFHDIVQGANGYQDTVGWDPVTGIGTPNVGRLAQLWGSAIPIPGPPAPSSFAGYTTFPANTAIAWEWVPPPGSTFTNQTLYVGLTCGHWTQTLSMGGSALYISESLLPDTTYCAAIGSWNTSISESRLDYANATTAFSSGSLPSPSGAQFPTGTVLLVVAGVIGGAIVIAARSRAKRP